MTALTIRQAARQGAAWTAVGPCAATPPIDGAASAGRRNGLPQGVHRYRRVQVQAYTRVSAGGA
jgi:hypothetical protein